MPDTLEMRLVKKAKPTQGVALFSIVRDEDYFLPFFFAHYRALGVETFLIYDDRSGEATKDFLHAQPDCAVAVSDHAFGDVFGASRYFGPRRLPTALRESAPTWAFADRWVVTADADEFLLPPVGFADLRDLAAHLDRIGQPYLTAPMVEFYGPTLNHRNYDPSLGPFEASQYFDVGPYYRWDGVLSPKPLPAGIRYRLQAMLAERHREAFAPIYGGRIAPPFAWKIPLLRGGRGVVRDGDHHLNVIPNTELSCALAHFKFYPGLDAKIASALSEAQYTDGSRHYRFMETAIRLLGDESLLGAPTRRFDSRLALHQANLLGARLVV